MRRLDQRLQTVGELAEVLGVTLPLLQDTVERFGQYYTRGKLEKRSGGYRTIYRPSAALRDTQRAINRRLLRGIALPEEIVGARPGRTLRDFVRPHVNKRCVMCLDIEDYFPSISAEAVLGCFDGIGCGPEVARTLTRLCTADGHLAQGFATSTYVANLMISPAVVRLSSLCAKNGLDMTLWIDDIAISGPAFLPRLLPTCEAIITDCGFVVSADKLSVTNRSQAQKVANINVNTRCSVPRPRRRELLTQIRDFADGLWLPVPKDMVQHNSQQVLLPKLWSVWLVNREQGRKLLQRFYSVPWQSIYGIRVRGQQTATWRT